MGQHEQDYVTRAEVLVLINDAIKPFHEQYTTKFDQLFAAMNQLSGSVKTAAWIIGVMLSIVAIVLGVRH